MKGQNILYLECYSGISGDMTVAALLDLGADEAVLREALDSLPVEGYEIQISRVKKSGLDACDFHVKLDQAHENHDHDMEYLHGKVGQEESLECHHHTHEEQYNYEGYSHTYEEQHSHEGHSHTHEHHQHRGLKEVLEIIDHAKMTPHAREIAVKIFQILAQAEAKAHGLPMDQVHFHEVGAVDSIVDVISTAVCLDNLNITEVIVPELSEGHGTIRCQHGIIPVPVPAVVNIVQTYGLTLCPTEVQGELVTPTGAAIVAAVRTSEQLPLKYKIEKVGLGAGKRNYNRPGLLRAMLIRSKKQEAEQDVIYKLETNIDDCTGEMMGHTMNRLLQAGARDVHYTPVYMKKNRPAYLLSVICKEDDISGLEKIMFQETTTIGIRRMKMERSVLHRELKKVSTSLGEVTFKICSYGQEQWAYPEYEDLAQIAAQKNLSYREVSRQVTREYEAL